MKSIALVLLLQISSIGFGQQLPEIQLETSRFTEHYTSEISDFVMQFDEFIIYANKGSWTKSYFCFVVGFSKNKWKGYILTVNYEEGRYSDQLKFRMKKRRKKIAIDSLNAVLTDFEKNEFYNLNLDSLDYAEIKVNDSLSELLFTTNGSTGLFTIRNCQGVFSISTYQPDYYQSRLFMDDRRKFLESRKMFLALFK